MRRNSIAKKNLTSFLLLGIFGIYICLSDVFVFLPPLLGLLFLYFARSMQINDLAPSFFMFFALIWIELDKNLSLGFLFLLFVLLYRLAYKPFSRFFSKGFFFKFFYVVLLYALFAFWAFGGVSFGHVVFLLGMWILIEGVLLLLYEFKN